MNTNTAKETAVENTRVKILEYLKDPSKAAMFDDLRPVCGVRRGEYVEGMSEYTLIDRALQSLRKAGKIEFDTKGWRLVAPKPPIKAPKKKSRSF